MEKKLLARVVSLSDLRHRALVNPAYEKLAIDAAKNLGGEGITSLEKAMHWLTLNANETDEKGIVDEVNFCR